MVAMLCIEVPVEDIQLPVALLEALLLDRHQLVRLQVLQAALRAHVLQFTICVCQVLDLLYGRHHILLTLHLQLPECVERELEWLELWLLKGRLLRLHLDSNLVRRLLNYRQGLLNYLMRLKMLRNIRKN